MSSDAVTLLLLILNDCITNTIIVSYYAFFAGIWYDVPFSFKRVLVCSLISVSSRMIVRFFAASGVVAPLITALTFWIIARILWQTLRGIRFWGAFLFCATSEFVLEFLTEFLYAHLCPGSIIPMHIGKFEIYFSEFSTLPTLYIVFILLYFATLFIFRIIHTNLNKGSSAHLVWRYQLHLFILIVLLVFVLVVSVYNLNYILFIQKNNSEDIPIPYGKGLPVFAVFLLAIFLLLFYGWQAVQQYKLYIDNKTLTEKNVAYQRVLDSTREFRHNIANLIYGFQGVIVSEDIDSIKQYYAEISRRCLLNNNENAAAINLIRDPALTALLLQKLDIARQQELPMYLNADSVFSFDAMPSSKLVEILGNLLDNAMEAALLSDSPRVNLTFRSTPQYDEILVANTYAHDANLSFLTGSAQSTKPGHQGLGLDSVRRIVRRYPSVCFNQYVAGRYIETSICRIQ